MSYLTDKLTVTVAGLRGPGLTTEDIADLQGYTDEALAARAEARAWADSDTPPDPTDPASKSAKTWSDVAEATVNAVAFQAAQSAVAGAKTAIQPTLDAATAIVAGIPARVQPYIDTATARANDAGQSATLAGQRADRADLAATQAAVAQPAYDTIAAGLAATPNGGVFNVRGSGDTFATSYRNDNGVASAPLGSFPSKAYMDGIAPAVNSKVMVLAKAANIDVSAPTRDNGAAIKAAFTDAISTGKTVDMGIDVFGIGGSWGTPFALPGRLRLRGDGAKFISASAGSKTLFALRAPIEIDGVDFDNFATIVNGDMNGVDFRDYDVVLRNINVINARQALIATTLESIRIRDLIIENVNVIGNILANGTGQGQGIRYQSNGFRRAYLRNVFVKNTSYQGIRIGGYPHDLVLNKHIHMETLHVENVISGSQSNGVQAFGSDVYMNDIYVTRVDCIDGGSSNVEPVYTVGDRVNLGNITIENGGNAQGSLAVKSSNTQQHGPIRIRTSLHPRMNAAIRIDGPNAELTKGITIEWCYETIVPSTPDGTDGYAVNYIRMDSQITNAVSYYFVPHEVNTTSAPRLNIGGTGLKTMVFAGSDAPIFPGMLRTDLVYEATYSTSNDYWRIQAVNWQANVPIVAPVGGVLDIEGTLVDGKSYWVTPMQTVAAGGAIRVGGSAPIPLMYRNSSGVLTPVGSGNASVSNGFEKAFYYSAADNAMIRITPSGHPYEGIGRFVPELRGVGDSFVFVHPYANEYADALFIQSPRDNTGPATLNGEPLLTSSGAAMTAGYLRANRIYQLIRSGSTWRATRVGGDFDAIDVAQGASGRQIIKDLTFINCQYNIGVTSTVSGSAEISNVKTLGAANLARIVAFGNPYLNAPNARAFAADFKLSYFGMDGPASALISISTGFSSLEVTNIPPAMVRGTPVNGAAVVLAPATGGPTATTLRFRNVRKHASISQWVSNSSWFASFDSDHTTEIANVNPPSVSAGSYSELASNYTHLGVEPGDAITVTHELNNTRIQFGGYATARDTVKVFVRDPNPAGAAVDLATGRLFITSRRLRGN